METNRALINPDGSLLKLIALLIYTTPFLPYSWPSMPIAFDVTNYSSSHSLSVSTYWSSRRYSSLQY